MIVNFGLPLTLQTGSQTFRSKIEGFSMLPFDIEFPVGTLGTTFRLSCPLGLKEGVYQINWESYGDWYPPLYTPIEPTKVYIT